MTAKGDPIPAKRALDAGLIDRLAGEDSLEADAIAFARACAGKPLPRARQKTATPDPAAVAAFTQANALRFRGIDAPARSDEPRVGEEGGSNCKSRRSPGH